MLYSSPFWPMKSGISEYSEILVNGLAEFYDITLLTDDYELSNKYLKDNFKIIKYIKGEVFRGYDVIIYNIGNNPYYHSYMYDAILNNPGYIILHDFVLYYLTIGYYRERGMVFQKIYQMAGIDGIQIMKQAIKDSKTQDMLQFNTITKMLPLNQEIISISKGIFVHSYYSERKINEIQADKEIYKINLSYVSVENNGANILYYKFHIPKEAYVVGSIGFIASTKQNEIICRAIKEYNLTHIDKIYYVMIGEGDCINDLLDEYIIKTGFFPQDEYISAIERCDLIFNLRYPSHGETSATLIQCMGRGKPCVVTDIGWFHEVPEECVVKLSPNITVKELVNKIEEFKKMNWSDMKLESHKYVNENCSPSKIAEEIFRHLSK